MAKHQYVTGVLFEGESDPDESPSGFRSRIPRPLPKKTINTRNVTVQEQKQLTIQKKQEIEQRTLQSAMRSLNILQETQDIGIHTATELVYQGEKLEKTNMMLDEIDSHLKQSQKDINGIKSVFYGFKKIIKGKPRSPSPSNRCKFPRKKRSKIAKSKFYGTLDHSLRGPMKLGEFETPSTSVHSVDVQPSAGPPSSIQVNDILQANLNGISHHLGQLKALGVGFQTEINHQTSLIDILQDKAEQADIKIGIQNKDMKKILGN